MKPTNLRILLLGGSGQLGKALKVTLPQVGHLVCAHPRGSDKTDVLAVDLEDVELIMRCLFEVQPDVVINAAAYTAVDTAQTEPSVARAINATGPPVLACELKKIGGVKPPREFVLMDRAAVGLGSVFMHLKAEINLHQMFHGLIEGFDEQTLADRQAGALVANGL